MGAPYRQANEWAVPRSHQYSPPHTGSTYVKQADCMSRAQFAALAQRPGDRKAKDLRLSRGRLCPVVGPLDCLLPLAEELGWSQSRIVEEYHRFDQELLAEGL